MEPSVAWYEKSHTATNGLRLKLESRLLSPSKPQKTSKTIHYHKASPVGILWLVRISSVLYLPYKLYHKSGVKEEAQFKVWTDHNLTYPKLLDHPDIWYLSFVRKPGKELYKTLDNIVVGVAGEKGQSTDQYLMHLYLSLGG